MLAVVAVVARAFLLAVRRVFGGVEVQEDARGRPVLAALAHVGLRQGPGDAQAVPRARGVLQAREGGLAGEVFAGLGQSAPAPA